MLWKPQSLKVVKYLLLKGREGFNQNEVARSTGVSVSYVNDIVKALKAKFIVSGERPPKLREARRLLLVLAAESSMAERLKAGYEMPGEKKAVEAAIAKKFGDKTGYAFTLLSALPYHGKSLAQGQQVSVYVDEKELESAEEMLRQGGGARQSSIGNVHVFKANEGVLWDRHKTSFGYCVSLEQLLIDLYASSALTYIGQELLLSKKA